MSDTQTQAIGNPSGAIALPDGNAPVPLENLDAQVQAKARQLAATIDVRDSNAILAFGTAAQNNVTTVAEQMMGNVRVKDSGEIGAALTELVGKIRGAGVQQIASPGAGIISKLFNGIQAFIARYEKLETQIDKVVQQLQTSKVTLMRDVAGLDQLYNKNVDFVHDLEVFIAAGQLRVAELRAKDLEDLKAKFAKTGDPMDAQAVNDFQGSLDRLEKKIHDLRLIRYIGIQSAPQIRAIQSNDAGLLDKVSTAINTTLPLWKRQVALLIAAYDTKKVADISNDVDDMTNQLIAQGAGQIRQINAEAAKANQRGVVEVANLKKADEDICAMLDDTIRIREEGRAMRAQAEKDLAEMESQLKAKLTAIRA